MAITKKYLKSKPEVCRVRFEFDGEEVACAGRVCVAGDFNGWDACAAPMTKKKNCFTYTVDLPAGQQYRFRYVVDGQTWHNDAQADLFENSGLGDSLNSVIAV
ncbi:MAG: isoamylase early set domain-containing protein [Desulfovibrionaceae bacterium]|nr:isoamylase early set domain-containing protein [Desulfovibrionaceae bacterium]MBF0513448.1 isoamylase early set domain-containing protein [Desulfovibrionaceae bacterium]